MRIRSGGSPETIENGLWVRATPAVPFRVQASLDGLGGVGLQVRQRLPEIVFALLPLAEAGEGLLGIAKSACRQRKDPTTVDAGPPHRLAGTGRLQAAVEIAEAILPL